MVGSAAMTDPRPSDAGDGRDPFILAYNASDLSIAAEFLTTWLPFLSRDLCPSCTHILSHRVRSLDPGSSFGTTSDAREPCIDDACGSQDAAHESPETPGSHDNFDANSLGSWKDSATDFCEPLDVATPSDLVVGTVPVRMSWADMAQEDELEEERAETEPPLRTNENEIDNNDEAKKKQKSSLPRDQREYIRFMNVQREKDFICLERVKGKFVNILEGLELHTGIFSAAEQKRIVECVYDLQDKGRKGKLRARTYSEPKKWMRGKGRATIQFGCCYNYAVDENGNPPGILQNEIVDPIPHLFKVMIKRMVGWHVLPPSCVPDSCIVNIYEPGDCIPPHIDNHDFVRPFCTVSFLSECDILFGSNLRIAGAGEFSGSFAIPLPVGSVLVLNGNGADVAKHCVPAVPTKRISITFRKMDERKQPFGFVADPDILGIQPTKFDTKVSRSWRSSKPQGIESWRASVGGGREQDRESSNRSSRTQRNRSGRNKSRPSNNHRELV